MKTFLKAVVVEQTTHFTIADIEEWQWNDVIMDVIRKFDYKRKIEQEKEAKRATALNKLTTEEREILGIK